MRYRFALTATACFGVAIFPAFSPAAACAASAEKTATSDMSRDAGNAERKHLLGAGDQLTVWAEEAEELNGKMFIVDRSGTVALPLIGSFKASGLTLDQFQSQLNAALGKYLKHPAAVVTVTELKSEPVSVTGAVNAPGVYQLRGRNSLAEMLSAAGGPRLDAGATVLITRQRQNGPLPAANAKEDSTTGASTAELNLRAVMAGTEANIEVLPKDVVTVSRSGTIFVLGGVTKPGAFPMGESTSVSLLQALALAGGVTRTASIGNIRLIRPSAPGQPHREIPIDARPIIKGQVADIELMSSDVVYVNESAGKRATQRTAEAIVQAATMMLGWSVVR